MKLFDKYVERLGKNGGKKLASRLEEKTDNQPIRIKAEFKTSPRIDLLLNKIATEYCAYNKILTKGAEELALKVRNLDDNFQNLFYCNPKENFREFKSGEISHYIKLWSNEERIYIYIELFNVIGSIIIIDNDYKGEDFCFQYYQDAITGEKFNDYPDLDNEHFQSIIELDLKTADFADMTNKLFKRNQDRNFSKLFDDVLAEIRQRLEKEVLDGKITDAEFNEKMIDESTSFIAQYQIENPYMWEDLDDANNDEINYIHSNLRENQFEEFCKKNSKLIGKKVRIDNDKIYITEKFEKVPVTEQNGIQIIKVSVVLYNGIERKRIPYREFFEGIGNK
ncbi:hypothetical protein [uncultured Aquimarina sp.]|uniref:hypothetical protein n=1 Tax=uncultured Aquimarina sp. TaxID=575652 RepID=UPI00262F4E42|nr:hypothetical protein [uncultured Aquimarina sp.]